jgi:hypothetical protein
MFTNYISTVVCTSFQSYNVNTSIHWSEIELPLYLLHIFNEAMTSKVANESQNPKDCRVHVKGTFEGDFSITLVYY